MSDRSGPFEERDWPERLVARALDPTPKLRLHGYDLERDLVRHYDLAEIMLIGLTGEAPSASRGRAFGAALIFASACPVNEAPSHAAVLARAIGAPVASALASGLIVACDTTRAIVEEHRAFLRWLDEGSEGPIPEHARANDEEGRETSRNLREHLASIDAFALAPSPEASRIAAILQLMWNCGLRSEDQLVVALSWARALSVGAETIASSRGGLTNFPARLPDFRYEAPLR